MEHYDVLIIGGGPAGAITGIELQKKGYHTCIIDKEAFPRTKLCGGLLTQKSMDLITAHCPRMDTTAFIVEQTETVDFYYQGKKVNTFPTRARYYLTERILLDTQLILEYQKQGGKLVPNVRIMPGHIDLKKNTVTTGLEKFSYKYLVGADGCNSVVCKAAKIRRHDFLCLEGNIPRDPKKKKELRIYFGVAKRGYGWYFPKKEHYCTGMGGYESGKSIRAKASRFFSEALDQQVEQVKGAFIPSGRKLSRRKLPKNALLVGDAAGFTDPITGEGLYFAMHSGILAADAIHNSAKRKNKNPRRQYHKNTLTIRKNICAARFWQSVLYFPPIFNAFMKHLETHTTFALFYLERVIATGEFNYSNFLWVYFRKIRSVHQVLP